MPPIVYVQLCIWTDSFANQILNNWYSWNLCELIFHFFSIVRIAFQDVVVCFFVLTRLYLLVPSCHFDQFANSTLHFLTSICLPHCFIAPTYIRSDWNSKQSDRESGDEIEMHFDSVYFSAQSVKLLQSFKM